jgi:glucose-6-phosphate 1-dehydrogenase
MASGAHVIVEKPFGRDFDSAHGLNLDLQKVIREHQIYRVDHIQITAAESVRVEQRGGYYETAGALRVMLPNHLFQLMCLTAMEPPVSFDANVVRDKQAEILKAIQAFRDRDVLLRTVRGQYGPCQSGMPGYRQEAMVTPSSRAETYLALKLHIDNWRWADVPFYVGTGKRMTKRVTEIVQFKRAPLVLFRKTAVEKLEPNRLVLHLQPEEGISLSFWSQDSRTDGAAELCRHGL